MFKKRGQVTLFIIIGVIMLLFLCFVIYTKMSNSSKIDYENVKSVNLNQESIKNYVETCLSMAVEEALWKVGAHGGYIDPKGNSNYREIGVSEFYQGRLPGVTYINNISVPYYIDSQRYPLSFPSIYDIEEKLARYTIVELENCLNFSTFEDYGFDITLPNVDYQSIDFDFDQTEVGIEVTTGYEDVSVEINYPMTFKIGQVEFRMKNFRANLPVRFRSLYNSAALLSNKIFSSFVYYNLGPDCSLYDTNGMTNLFYKKSDYGDWDIIQLIDYSTYHEKFTRSYVFQFAIKNVGFVGECYE